MIGPARTGCPSLGDSIEKLTIFWTGYIIAGCGWYLTHLATKCQKPPSPLWQQSPKYELGPPFPVPAGKSECHTASRWKPPLKPGGRGGVLAEPPCLPSLGWNQDRRGVVFGSFPDPVAPVAEKELTKAVPKVTITGVPITERVLQRQRLTAADYHHWGEGWCSQEEKTTPLSSQTTFLVPVTNPKVQLKTIPLLWPQGSPDLLFFFYPSCTPCSTASKTINWFIVYGIRPLDSA